MKMIKQHTRSQLPTKDT